jgi:hypothetical protein
MPPLNAATILIYGTTSVEPLVEDGKTMRRWSEGREAVWPKTAMTT